MALQLQKQEELRKEIEKAKKKLALTNKLNGSAGNNSSLCNENGKVNHRKKAARQKSKSGDKASRSERQPKGGKGDRPHKSHRRDKRDEICDNGRDKRPKDKREKSRKHNATYNEERERGRKAGKPMRVLQSNSYSSYENSD